MEERKGEGMNTQTDYDVSKLRPGAWYSLQYGFGRKTMCVIHSTPSLVILEAPDWCYSAALHMTPEEMFGSHHRALFIGYGRKRHIMGFIRRLSDCFGTTYTNPL